MKEVSIIIPNFNGSFWIDRTLKSCLLQKDYIHEIIIIDDNSSDNSLEILEKWKENHPAIIKIFSLSKNMGSNYTRNFGYTISTGKFIQWQDIDDQIIPGKLKNQVNMLKLNPSFDFAYSDFKIQITNNHFKVEKIHTKKHKQYNDMLFALLLDKWSPPINYIFNRNFFKKIDNEYLWNPNTRILQDREFIVNCAIRGAKGIYVQGIYSIYNKWSNNTVSNKNKTQRAQTLNQLLLQFKESILLQKTTANKTAHYS